MSIDTTHIAGVHGFPRHSVVMFTDIVDSTGHKHRRGTSEYAALVARHDALLREIVESHDGSDLHKDTGDGFIILFAHCASAVTAALCFQHALHEEAWGSEPIRVRIGIHSGEVTTSGPDINGKPKLIGTPIDVASRVQSVALPSQILLTGPVYADAKQFVRSFQNGERDSIPRALHWTNHGPYQFKGGELMTVDVFEVGVDGIAPLASPPDSDKAWSVRSGGGPTNADGGVRTDPPRSAHPDRTSGLRRGRADRTTAFIDIKLDRDFETFSEQDQGEFVHALAKLMRIANVRVITKRPGSVILRLEVDSKDVAAILRAAADGTLARLGVLDVTPVSLPLQDSDSDARALRHIEQGVVMQVAGTKYRLGMRGRHSQLVAVDEVGGGLPLAGVERALPPGVNAGRAIGQNMMTELAARTHRDAGDGTTTAKVLGEAMFKHGLRYASAGASPVAIQRGINAAAQVAAEAIGRMALPCRTVADCSRVAAASSDHDAGVAELIAEAIARVGIDGTIAIEEGTASQPMFEVVPGMQFDRGYLSPHFQTDPQNAECVLDDPVVLVYEGKLTSAGGMLPLLDSVVSAGKPLLIIADDVEGEALATLVVNRLRNVLQVCAVKAPGFGARGKAMLGDIAVVTGGLLVSDTLARSLESIELSELGRARKVVIDKDTCTIIDGSGQPEAISKRIEEIKLQIELAVEPYDREKLKERLAAIANGVAVIRVCGPTEAASKELKCRVRDALHATRAAIQEGYVAGGGIALLRTQAAIEGAKASARGDERIGFDVVWAAVEAPLRQIVENAGFDSDAVVAALKDQKTATMGFNAATAEFVDMVQSGLIDTARMAKSALIHAASVAGLMLTADVLISETSETERIVMRDTNRD